jgi:transcriptional regulator with XRE-family HTH domain
VSPWIGISLTPAQIRDARRLAGLSADDLGRQVGISRKSVERFETSAEGLEKAAFGTVKRIVLALEAAGIEFLPDGGVTKRRQYPAMQTPPSD